MTRVTPAMKHAVSVWVGQTLEKLGRLDLIHDLSVGWSSRFTSAMGKASIKRGNKIRIVMNTPSLEGYRVEKKTPTRGMSIRFSEPLWPRASPRDRRETVIHEVCHIVAFQIAWEQGRKIRGHGPEWKALMRRCGIEPSRTHSIDNAGLSNRRRIELDCNCPGKTIKVTPYIAGRMAAGATYACKTCNTTLSPPPGTKPVAKIKRRRKRK